MSSFLSVLDLFLGKVGKGKAHLIFQMEFIEIIDLMRTSKERFPGTDPVDRSQNLACKTATHTPKKGAGGRHPLIAAKDLRAKAVQCLS